MDDHVTSSWDKKKVVFEIVFQIPICPELNSRPCFCPSRTRDKTLYVISDKTPNTFKLRTFKVADGNGDTPVDLGVREDSVKKSGIH